MRRARVASNLSPVRKYLRELLSPMRRYTYGDITAGARPRRASVRANLADSTAMVTSQQASSPSPPAVQTTAARLHATFARLPTFDPPADDLKIFDHAPLDANSRITQFFLGEIKRKLGVVKAQRKLVNRTARAYLMAGVSYVRADAGW